MAHSPKPFASIDQQISILKSRGMSISDEDFAKRCLGRIGYYRLSAYWYPFREMMLGPTPHKVPTSSLRVDPFVSGTSFEEVFDFYIFDKKLRVIIADGLERIEIAMRAIISEKIGSRDPCAHRNPQELDGQFSKKILKKTGQPEHQEWLRKQDRQFAQSREDFAEHFRDKYPHHVPPVWVSCEVWDWGMLSHFYSGMQQKDRDEIANRFGPIDGRHLSTWLRAMNDARNFCAHHSRLWNKGLKVTPSLPRRGVMPIFEHLPRNDASLSRVYTLLILMRIMLLHIHPSRSQWHRRVVQHVSTCPGNPLIGPAKAGFPQDWELQTVWR